MELGPNGSIKDVSYLGVISSINEGWGGEAGGGLTILVYTLGGKMALGVVVGFLGIWHL